MGAPSSVAFQHSDTIATDGLLVLAEVFDLFHVELSGFVYFGS